VFQGHILLDCVSRIHQDITEVWNFYDPDKLLSGKFFCGEMLKLIEPLLTKPQAESRMKNTVTSLSALTSIAGAVGIAFAQVLGGAGIAIVAVKFLCEKYQAIPLTALCLGAYIVDLTLVLNNLFVATLVREPPRPLTRELVEDTLRNYKDSEASDVHQLIHGIVHGTRIVDPKDKIADLIRQQLKMDRE